MHSRNDARPIPFDILPSTLSQVSEATFSETFPSFFFLVRRRSFVIIRCQEEMDRFPFKQLTFLNIQCIYINWYARCLDLLSTVAASAVFCSHSIPAVDRSNAIWSAPDERWAAKNRVQAWIVKKKIRRLMRKYLNKQSLSFVDKNKQTEQNPNIALLLSTMYNSRPIVNSLLKHFAPSDWCWP